MSDAAESIDLTDPFRIAAFTKLRNQLFLSPRLSQWQLGIDDKGNKGYWLKSKDQTVTVTVREGKVILSVPDLDNPRVPFHYDVINDEVSAGTLYKSIQDAQIIVQPKGLNGMAPAEEDEFFTEDDPEYIEGAGLDPALEETHPDSMVQEDADLIEEVCSDKEPGDEEIESELQRITEEAEALKLDIEAKYASKINEQNSKSDGVICSYCGNLNTHAYKGSCPQCPQNRGVPEQIVLNTVFVSNLKSLQGRVLTIIDGSFADKTQREAVKSLVNKEFRREIGKVTGK